MIFNMTGGTSLNFKVVGGTTEPSNPKENTIWVNTDKEITGWNFASEQPEDMKEGEVWIPTGKPSTIKVNLLKKNSVIVYPLSAQQMISGELKEATAKCYQNGEWVELWNGYLFDNGKVPSFVTEWKSNQNGSALTLDVGENTIHAYAKNYGTLWCYPFPAIDVTPYSKYIVDMSIDRGSTSDDPNYILISKSGGSAEADARTLTNVTGRQTLELDISSFEGVYYCGFAISSWKGAETNAYIYSMKFVK